MENVRTLIDADALKKRIDALGAEITKDFRGKDLVMVTVLKGSYMFAADLSRAIDLPLTVDFLGLRSYGDGTESSGVVQITTDLSQSVEDKHVLVVEDIVDTGLTMEYLLENLRTRHPASVKLVSLLHKPARTRVKVDIDYLGFTIDDVFVIGYGLDYAQRYRNLPFIGVWEGT
jgi:hypoxanthine phosphoribosyltransferase